METPDTTATGNADDPVGIDAAADDITDHITDDLGDGLDLDAVERDLLGVEVALERLDDGTYWTDELDGRPIPDDVLERDPITRRAP